MFTKINLVTDGRTDERISKNIMRPISLN